MSDDASRESDPSVQPTPPGVGQGDGADQTRPIQPVPPGVDPSDETGARSIQPAPPGVEPAPAASSGKAEQESAGATRRIQPVPPDATSAPESGAASAPASGADVPTAEMEVGVAPAEAKPVQPTPSSLYDVPWQPADEPIPAWITEQAAEKPAPASTSVAPAARPASGASDQGSGYAAAGRQSVPPRSGYGGGAAASPSNRPRRAGIIAASVVALAIVLVGGGVIALLATRGSGEGAQGGAATTIADVVDSTILPPTSTPSTPAPGPGTSPPTPAPTTPPPTATPTTPPPTPAPPGSPNTVPGDLSLAEPMRRPACDGQYIVITANAVTPGQYQRQVADAQQRFVGSAYLKTDQTCPSLRPFDDLGNAIYSVYYGPFPTLADACRIRAQVGGDSYVKILDQATPFTKIWECV